MRRRRWLIVLLVLAALPAAAFLALRGYLASEWGRRWVEAELAASIGARVELGGVDAGLLATNLHDLQVFLPGDTDTPTLATAEVQVALPLWKLLDEEAVLQRLTLAGPAIALRFDRAGRILTQPPAGQASGPANLQIRLDNARLTLRQEGKPDLRVGDIRAAIQSDGRKLTLKGRSDDPDWGKWQIAGEVEPETGAAGLRVVSERVALTPERLAGLPFVPAEVWNEIHAEGLSSVDLAVRHKPGDDEARYRIILQPKQAAVRVAAIDLYVTDAAGQVVIEDGRVLLEGVQARAAGGSLTVQADLDFRTRPERLRFTMAATDLDLRQLPRSWDLPEFLEGKLSGQAELGVELIGNGGVRTSGQGQGQIRAARIGGAATAEPVAIQLRSQGRGFRFQAAPPRSGLSFRFDSDLANSLAGALWHAVRPFADTGRGLVDWRGWPGRSAPAPTYLRFHVELKEIELGRFLEGIGIPLNLPLEGLASIDVHVDLPVDNLAEPKRYRLDGMIRLPHLKAADLEFHDVAARLDYRDGVLRVVDLAGRPGVNGLPVGGFTGSATLGMVPAGDLQADLQIDGLPLPRALSDVLTGWVSGTLRVQAPLERFGEINAWQATARVTDSRLAVAGRLLALTAEQVTLAKGTMSTPAFAGTLDDVQVMGAGSLVLARPQEFVLDLVLKDAEVAQVCQLLRIAPPAVPLQGPLHWTNHVSGTLEPLRYQANGRVAGQALTVDCLPFKRVAVAWRTDGQTLEVESLSARYGFGQVDGTATLPLAGDRPGRAAIQFREFDLKPLARQLAGLDHVEGRVFGRLEARIGATRADGRRDLGCELKFFLPRIKVQMIAGERLEGTATLADGQWSYACDGALLDGRLHLEGRMATDQPLAAKLTVEGAQLDRLRREMMQHPDRIPLHGRVDLELTLSPEASPGGPQARGRLWLQQLRYDTSSLADRLQSDLQLRGTELIVDNLSGGFCRGLLRGRAVVNTAQPDRSVFDLSLDRGNARDLLAPWPDLARQVSGSVEARLQTALGDSWRTSGLIALARGKVYGVDVAEWRLPIDASFAPASGTGQVDVRDSHAQLARGRAVGSASYTWGHSNRLEGKVRFFDLHLLELAPAAANFNRLDGGTVSGRLDFAGNNVDSLNDLTAQLDATLKQARAFELPIFEELAPYVAPRQSRRVPFETGDLKARLAHGVVTVEHLRLTGGVVQLLMEGTLNLQGRVELDVTASTGVGAFQSSVLRRLGIDLPGNGPVSGSALARAASQLSARLVRLKVTGSVHNPQVRIVPLYQLTEDALRFFLSGPR